MTEPAQNFTTPGTATIPATVASTERITSESSPDEVREITLDVGVPEFAVEAGQSVGVLVPVAAGFHSRLYSVADLPTVNPQGTPRITICVRRCIHLGKFDGKEHRGIASNYLCDREPGDPVTLTGPYGLAFEVPAAPAANLILIGTGTGIAPFRAFVKDIYRNHPEFSGRIWLFYGARTGLELLYMNDEKDDFSQYYDEETFRAFKALSPRPNWADPIAWDLAFAERGAQIWEMLAEPNTFVYVAGLNQLRDELDEIFTSLAGSAHRWERRRAALRAERRWVELLY